MPKCSKCHVDRDPRGFDKHERACHGVVSCACGCGGTFLNLGVSGKRRRFLYNHHRRVLPGPTLGTARPIGQMGQGYIGELAPGHPRANRYNRVRQHILVAERALGKPLPPLAVVHHHNEIRSDNSNSNLVICEDDGYHQTLHARMRVLKAGGDPNKDRLCNGPCRQLKPMTEFGPSKTRGLNPLCRECVRTTGRLYYKQKMQRRSEARL